MLFQPPSPCPMDFQVPLGFILMVIQGFHSLASRPPGQVLKCRLQRNGPQARRSFLLPLPTFTLGSPLHPLKQACGPEARTWCGKSIGGEKIMPGGLAWFPQYGAGRSGARSREARDAPTSENPCSRKKNGLPALYHTRYRARPIQETRRASWFFRTMPLLLGRAWLEIRSPLCLRGEKWRWQAFRVMHALPGWAIPEIQQSSILLGEK